MRTPRVTQDHEREEAMLHVAHLKGTVLVALRRDEDRVRILVGNEWSTAAVELDADEVVVLCEVLAGALRALGYDVEAVSQ